MTSLTTARNSFDAGRDFLAVASVGIPTRETTAALRGDLDLWSAARRDPQDYDGIIENTRGHFARLVGVGADRVACGSQTSVIVSVVAAAVPDGAEVLCVDGDFSSIIFPFLQRPSITVRNVPLAGLAAAITDATWLVVFSHVQSATGVVADVDAITAAAEAHDAYTLCDITQSAGVHPVDASRFDATVCHSYKWLCSPRGVAFLTLSTRFQSLLVPLQAGWYAGDDVWQSCYGPTMTLARDARAFDVSPAWPAWVGAEPAIRMFADLDISGVWDYTSGLGDALCDGLGIPQQHQAIVTWADPDGSDLGKLNAVGIRASGRAGRLRAAFHLWNDDIDVEHVLAALR
ncbi:MAG: aminotransferase [Microbacteriaceae bacterium]|nr:aminotransferase [Microbacteriaceae bacterium]